MDCEYILQFYVQLRNTSRNDCANEETNANSFIYEFQLMSCVIRLRSFVNSVARYNCIRTICYMYI